MPALDILLDDDCILVINKPSGLATQAPKQYDSLERRVRARLTAIGEWQGGSGDPRGEYLGLPHRLDSAATGVILLAKTKRAARVLSRQFERRQIKKLYWAVVAGTVEPASGTWTDYVRKLPDIAQVEIVNADTPGALEAVLHYRATGQYVLDSQMATTCLEIELETGRTHQIRIQAASRGWPLLGDALYGSTIPFGPPVATSSEVNRQRAIALHARSIAFVHPTTQELTTIVAEPPEWWKI